MTNEQIAALLQSDREEFKELLPVLWKKTQRLLFKMSGDFYAKHSGSCIRRGVELVDLEGSCYAVFLAALDAYKPDKPTLFTTYFSYQFQLMTAELLNIRTERGRQEPLDNCDSLDRQIEQGDGSTTTLSELIADDSSSFEDDVLEALDRDAEAKTVREAVGALPEAERLVIERYYFEGRHLQDIGTELDVSFERVRQIKSRALRELRKNKLLRAIYNERKHHDRWIQVSGFEWSPEFFDLRQSFRERSLSYGQQQAEIYAAERKWIAEHASDSSNA